MKQVVAKQPRIYSWEQYQSLSIQVVVCGLLVPLLLQSSHIY